MAEAEDYSWDSEEWIGLCVLKIVNLCKSLSDCEVPLPPPPPAAALQAAAVGTAIDVVDGVRYAQLVNEDECYRNQLQPLGSSLTFLGPGWEADNIIYQAVLDIPTAEHDPSSVKEWLTSYIANYSLSANVVKTNSSYVLLSFSGLNAKETFFSQITKDDKTGLPYKLHSVMNSASTSKMYPIFVQLSFSATQQNIGSEFQELMKLFGGKLFLQLIESQDVNRLNTSEKIPRLFVIMTLDLKLPQTVKRRDKFLVELDGKSCWKKIERGSHELNSTQLYIHEGNPLIAIGFAFGAGTGVKIQLNASSKDNFSRCCQYYSKLMNAKSSIVNSDGASHMTLPARMLNGFNDPYLEFRVNYNPSYQVADAHSGLVLNIISGDSSPHDLESEQSHRRVGKDPDNNDVACNTPLVWLKPN